MFPIRDHNPSGRIPYVTYAIIALNVVIFVSYAAFLNDNAAMASIFGNFALVPAELVQGEETYTLLTSMFMHGGWMHLAGNMLFLWIFGDNLEDMFGHVGFLIFYLVSGVAADLAHILPDPNSQVPLVGASGAIAGVMGGYLLLFPKARVDVLLIFVVFFRVFSLAAWMVLMAWFGMQIFSGMSTPTEGGGVAYWAHAGGFVAGLVLCLPIFLKRGGPAFWERTEGHPDHPPQKIPERISNIPVVQRRRK